MSQAINEFFGWLWVGFGLAVGGVLGLRFHHEGWLGGYGSWARRLVRLGHVAMIGLGGLNVLFAQSVARMAVGEGWVRLAAWSLIAGAVLMPACCFLAAWRASLRVLFPAPVLLLGLGVTIAWVGLLGHLLGGGP